jgi:hypothetical protein
VTQIAFDFKPIVGSNSSDSELRRQILVAVENAGGFDMDDVVRIDLVRASDVVKKAAAVGADAQALADTAARAAAITATRKKEVELAAQVAFGKAIFAAASAKQSAADWLKRVDKKLDSRACTKVSKAGTSVIRALCFPLEKARDSFKMQLELSVQIP